MQDRQVTEERADPRQRRTTQPTGSCPVGPMAAILPDAHGNGAWSNWPDGTHGPRLHAVERSPQQPVPHPLRVADLIARWREAERQLLAADPLGDDAIRLANEVELARDQYHELVLHAVDAHSDAHR